MELHEDRVDAQAGALNSIELERARQDDEFGVQVHDPVYWFAVLGKQVGQLGQAVVDRKWAANKTLASRKMYHEAAQVAAVAVALMEAITLDELPDEISSALPRDPRQRARAMDLGHEHLRYDDPVAPVQARRKVEDHDLPNTDGGMTNDLC